MALLDRLRTNTPTRSRRNKGMSDSGEKKQQKRTETMRKPENERAGGAEAKLVHRKRARERDL